MRLQIEAGCPVTLNRDWDKAVLEFHLPSPLPLEISFFVTFSFFRRVNVICLTCMIDTSSLSNSSL